MIPPLVDGIVDTRSEGSVSPTNFVMRTEYPIPKEIKGTDFDNPNSNKTINTEEFLERIRSVSATIVHPIRDG